MYYPGQFKARCKAYPTHPTVAQIVESFQHLVVHSVPLHMRHSHLPADEENFAQCSWVLTYGRIVVCCGVDFTVYGDTPYDTIFLARKAGIPELDIEFVEVPPEADVDMFSLDAELFLCTALM